MPGDDDGLRFPHLLSTPRHRWWKPLVGILFALFVLVVLGVVLTAALVLGVALSGSPVDSFTEEALNPATPLGLLGTNLSLAMLTPAALLTMLVVHRQRPGLVSSVMGRLRRGFLARLFLVALVVSAASYGLTHWLTTLLSPSAPSSDQAFQLRTLLALAAVIVLTTPLQAAGEEYAFRGYLSQAITSWHGRSSAGAVAAALITAFMFALAHGTQDAWLFADRFAFGLIASWLAWRTGGLEAPIALHAANNLVALGTATFTGELEAAFATTTLGWPYAVADVTMIGLFAVLAASLATHSQVAVVSERTAVGYPGRRLDEPTGSDASGG